MKRLLIALLSSLLFALAARPQDLPRSLQQQFEEQAARSGDETPKDDERQQQLNHFLRHRLNINTAAREELQSLGLLTDLQINNILRYRSIMGRLININELQAIPDLDPQTCQLLAPFVTIGESGDTPDLATALRKADRQLLFRLSETLERSRGYDQSAASHYLGSPLHLTLRFTNQYRTSLYYGVVADKDAGEQFFRGAQRQGFDFYSLHFFLRNMGRLKALALGDYTVNMGQGLVQWQSFSAGITADALAIKRQGPVLAPYRSAGEYNFNRGAALTWSLGSCELTAFASAKHMSGHLNDSSTAFTSVNTSGYYRTPTEIARRNNLTDLSAGGVLAYRRPQWHIAANWIIHHFSLPLIKSAQPYNQFAINGNNLFNGGIDFAFTSARLHAFGEAALNRGRHPAAVAGLLMSLTRRSDLSALVRWIDKQYNAWAGNAFTQASTPQNEQGLYLGYVFRPSSKWTLNALFDFYHYPAQRYQISAPAIGSEQSVQAQFQSDRRSAILLKLRWRHQPKDVQTNGALLVADARISSVRLQYEKTLSRYWHSSLRLEWLHYAHYGQNESGLLTFASIGYRHTCWKVDGRLQYFSAGSYNSRIYTYESGVLYDAGAPSFFNTGWRYYMNAELRLGKHLSTWFRWAQTIYPQQSQIGSGLDRIPHNHTTQLTWQTLFQI